MSYRHTVRRDGGLGSGAGSSGGEKDQLRRTWWWGPQDESYIRREKGE